MVKVEKAELSEIMEKIESIEDEQAAIDLLKDFNVKTKKLGNLIMNRDVELSHKNWEAQCEEAKKETDLIVKKIREY
jgi:hypothetical protein